MSTRTHVLAALKDAGAAGVSGETLANELGVSRVAVSKHVSALRALGYVVEASPGSGYRLVASPDLALPDEVAPLLRNPFWSQVHGGPETGSTNADARELARAGAPEGTVVVAGRQTAGRGRLGRTWESPPGGAYVSVILRPAVAPAEVGPLALVVAIGIARGLRDMGVEASVKWPNDLRIGESKVAGVLLEMSAEGDRVDYVVAGFGLNVSRPEVAAPSAAYVSDVAADVGVAQAAAAALDGIAACYAVWLDAGFDALREEYESHSCLTGQDVVVSDAMGTVRARGTVLGVDAEGRLLVEGRAGVEAVVAGEVTLRPPA